MEQSKQFALNLRDFLNGLVVAVGSAVVTVVQTSLDAGTLKFNWHAIGVVAISATVAYLGKNLFSKPTEKTAPSK
jgi:bacteriorhodopsin